MDTDTQINGEEYADAISKLEEEFNNRFARRTEPHFNVFADTFSLDVQDAPQGFKWSLLTSSANLDSKPSLGILTGKQTSLCHF